MTTKKEKPTIKCVKDDKYEISDIHHIECLYCLNKQSCEAMLNKLNKEQDETNKTISGTDTSD